MSLPFDSPWLLDYLMHALVITLQHLGWEKEIVRSEVLEQRRIGKREEYLFHLCVANNCDRLLLAADQASRYGRRFHANGITILSPHKKGSSSLRSKDSILDAVARYPIADIRKALETD
jgi:hypothetical protein